MNHESIRNTIAKVKRFLQIQNPAGAVMIVNNEAEETKVFDRCNSDYEDAALYMLHACLDWIASYEYEDDEDDQTYTPETLLLDYIKKKDFGCTMGVYIMNTHFDFIRIGYDD